MARKQAFTPASIESLTCGKLKDPNTPGLFVAVLTSGKKALKFRRRIVRSGTIVERTFGHFPACTIGTARQLAAALNEQVEAGIDPRAAEREAADRHAMTVAFAHGLYMGAVREGRASRAKRTNKPRTIADKLAIYRCDIAPALGSRIIRDVVEDLSASICRCRAAAIPSRLVHARSPPSPAWYAPAHYPEPQANTPDHFGEPV